MKSNLNKEQFQRRLTALTSKDKEIFFITPYNSSGTPFCGTYDDTTFELTRNSILVATKTIKIKGEYKKLNEDSTEVFYKVGWTNFAKNLFIVIIGLAFVGGNIALMLAGNYLGFSFVTMFLTLNGLLIFICFWVMTINWIIGKIVNQRFKEEFEIEIENEWEKLTGIKSGDGPPSP